MSEQWYVAREDKQRGPFSWEQVQEMARSGIIAPDDMVWKEGMDSWARAGDTGGLFSAYVPSPAAQPKKSNILKILLIVGLVLVVLFVIGVTAIFFLVRGALSDSEAYAMALAAIQEDPRAIEILGEPIEEDGGLSGNVEVSNGSGEAALSFSVKGPLKTAFVETEAERRGGVWTLTLLQLYPEGEAMVDLLLAAEPPPVEDEEDLLEPGEDAVDLPELDQPLLPEEEEEEEEMAFPGDEMVLFREEGMGFTLLYPASWDYDAFTDEAYFNDPVTGMTMSTTLIYHDGSIEEIYDEAMAVYESIDATLLDTDEGREIISGKLYDYIFFSAIYEGEVEDYFEMATIYDRGEDLFLLLVFTTPINYIDESIIFADIVTSIEYVPF